jgi:hypothetical protein
MSWKAEVIADRSGKWVSNLLRFATRDEAWAYAVDLARRWTLVTDFRVTECDDPVTARLKDGGLLPHDDGHQH